MKKLTLSTLLLAVSLSSFAQEEEKPKEYPEKGKFRRDNIFLGGGIGLGYSSGFYGSNFNFGITPEVGYTVAQWLDAGVSVNLNYYTYSSGDNSGYTEKQKSFNYGGGVFLRAYPIDQFFIQLLPEYNWIDTKISSNISTQTIKYKQQAASLLAGIGYGRRLVGQTNFYTVLMIDLASETASPYRDAYNSPIPILRAGFNWYLRPKRKK